jgi:magnesium transporter
MFLRLHPADRADVFELLEENEQTQLLRQLDVPKIADLFDELEDHETVGPAESLTMERLAEVLDEMDPDEAADLLGDINPEKAERVLNQMDEPDDILPLLIYPDDTAGGRMTTAFIGLQPDTSVEDAIRHLRHVSIENDVPYYLFVVDEAQHLNGVVGMRELVTNEPEVAIGEIMDRDVIYIQATSDQEFAARMMTHYDLSALPVLDEDDRILGVITHDDILDVIVAETTEDIYRLSSVADTDLAPESSVGEQLKGRLPWLLLNTGTALFASWVISNFGDLFVQVAVLAFFQSVVAGQGGNAASQNVAMIVRALALEKLELKRIWKILFHQMWVGFLQGSIIGLIVGTGVGMWQNNPYLGLVLGLALIGNMLVAGIVGTLAPLLLKSIGQDPALASTVLVTAATDSLGFFIFLTLARIFLPAIMQHM